MASDQREDRPARRRNPALDVQIPFFRPLWRRVLAFAVVVLWAGMEIWQGSPYWAALAGGIGLYLAYQFFIAFNPDVDR